MPKLPDEPPSYLKRVDRDREYAYVTLTDPATKKRRTYRLGPYGSPESRQRYAQVLATWEAKRRALPDAAPPPSRLTVTQLCFLYWRDIQSRYSRSELAGIKQAIRVLRALLGTSDAAAVGPNAMRTVRDAMIVGGWDSERERWPWSRPFIAKQVSRIGAIFKWAAAHELIPIATYHTIKALEPLRRGQSAAREPERVRPASTSAIAATKRHVSRQVEAMIGLQLLTGMRSGEVTAMRPCDIDMTGEH